MPPSARLMAIVRQMEKEGIHLDSRHLTAIYSALPQNIAPGLSRKDISAADISIQVFEQVERALEDSKVQQFIRGALIREWPKEDRLNALYEFMKNVPIDPGTADLSQLYAVLPSELPGGISKNEIGYVNLSSQAYGELRSALQNPEVQDYLMNSGFMLRPVRVACAGLIAKILELGLPLSSRDPAGIATGLPAELRWQQTEKGVLSRATSMRSESRIAPGLLSSVDANDIVQETQRKGPDAARTMLEQSGRSELGRISSTFDDGSADLIAVLKEAPSMPSALPEAVAQLSGRLGNNAKLFDWPTLQASLENILMPKAMAETVNADVANIVPARMKLLMDTLANAKGSLTIGLDLSTGQDAGISAAVLEQLLKTIGERSGIVNELAVSGKLPGPARQALKSKGVNDRPMRPNQSFIPINTQTAVPLILNSRAANGVIHEVFYPIVGDRGTVTDTLVNDYANLLEVVAAIHCADIISRQPDLLKKPDLLKAELLKTLFRQEQGAVENLVQVRAGGRGFTISSAAVKVYLEMMAKQSIEQAA